MSGQQLVDSLKSLQFPHAESLEPQALDWMFENEAVSPMLEWFCHNISQANILQKKETEELFFLYYLFTRLSYYMPQYPYVSKITLNYLTRLKEKKVFYKF